VINLIIGILGVIVGLANLPPPAIPALARVFYKKTSPRGVE